MRTWLVATVLLGSLAASAQEAPPAPLAPEAEVPPAPVEPPTEKKPPDFTPVPAPKPEEHRHPDTGEPATGFGGAACWGAGWGCVGGGCLPAIGTGVGATILISTISAGISQGGCGGVVLVVLGAIYGIAIGAPGALLLGPCSACPAAGGGVVGAWLEDRDVWPVVVGSIPGLVLATLGTAGTVWGLLALNDGADLTVPTILLGSSAAASLLSGPATIVGVAIADGMAEPVKPDDKTPVKKATPKPDDPRKDANGAQVVMGY